MSYKADKSADLVKELAQTLNSVGTDKTVLALQQARENIDVQERIELIEQFILRKTCQSFKISQKLLFSSKSKGGRVDVLTIIWILQKKHLNYSLSESAACFRKDPSLVSKYITSFNNLKESEKHGLNMINKYRAISELVEDFKRTFNN